MFSTINTHSLFYFFFQKILYWNESTNETIICHSRDIQILISLDFAFFFFKSTFHAQMKRSRIIASNLDLKRMTKNIRHEFGKYHPYLLCNRKIIF